MADLEFAQIGDHGKEILAWDIDEYAKYERGWLWYVIATAVGLGLMVYAIVTSNFLFALIIVMFSLALYLSIVSEPAKIRFAVTEDGLEVGHTFYPYRQLQSFWLIYDPPLVKNVYFEFVSPIKPRLTIELDEMNPNAVRSALAGFIREDLTQVEEPLSDILGRLFKI